MLTFVVSEFGVRPEYSNIYPNGYQVLTNTILEFMPYSSIKVDTGLILSCPCHDFIHIVIDDTYNNLLKIENSILEINSNKTCILVIKNMTNNTIKIDNGNILCHFYSKDKSYLHDTMINDRKIQCHVYDDVIQNSHIVVNNNITNTMPVEEVIKVVEEVIKEEMPKVVEEVIIKEETIKVVEEVAKEVVEEVIIKEVAKEVVEELVKDTVQKVVDEIVADTKILPSNNLELHIDTSEIDNNITSVKRKYIRKKKTKTSLN